MASDNGSQLDWLLAELVRGTPGTLWALLLSSDGLPTASHGLEDDKAAYLSAIASGLLSTGHTADRLLGGRGQAQEVALRLSETLLCVTAAGERSALAVGTAREADLEVVAHAMERLVHSVEPFLATPARAANAAGQG